MATKDKILRYAQQHANREQRDYHIKQQGNGQWLMAPGPTCDENKKFETVRYQVFQCRCGLGGKWSPQHSGTCMKINGCL